MTRIADFFKKIIVRDPSVDELRADIRARQGGWVPFNGNIR